MAVREGASVDGLNLDDVPQYLKGISCYFCHSVDSVETLHNNGLTLSDDRAMRGGVDDPVDTPAHVSKYSALLDGRYRQSSDLCGSCHDQILPNGLPLERTHMEWTASFYADFDPGTGESPTYSQRCNSCHLSGRDAPIADAPGARADRRHHDHSMPGPGVVVNDFPNPEDAPDLKQANWEAMEEFRSTALCASLCVEEQDTGDSAITVWLHNETAGHAWPSGANQDRRAWVQLQAFTGTEATFTSGLVGDTEPLQAYVEDPTLWWFGDRLFDKNGEETHLAWEAATYEARSLPVAEDIGGDATTWKDRLYTAPGPLPDRVELRVKLRALPLDLLEELVTEGHLTAAMRDALPTFDIVPLRLDWTPETAEPSDAGGTCVSTSVSCFSPYI
ncbi:MAG: hypothetical protein GY946_13080 [bacterium]|nr:hypothetical protein [bacterium]